MKTTNLILSVLFFAVLGTVLSLAINIEPLFGLLLSGIGFLPLMPFGVLGMGLDAGSENVTSLAGEQTAPSDIGFPVGAVLVPKGAEFATDELALVLANWLNNINSTDGVRWRVLPFEYNVEPTKEDDQYVPSSTGNVRFAVAGKTTVNYFITVTPFVKSQLNNLNGIKWDIYILTSNGFIVGTSDDGIKFQPQQLQNFRVEGEVLVDLVNMVKIVWTYADPEEDNSRPSFLQPKKEGTPAIWNIKKSLKDPKAIRSVISSASTSGFTIVLTGYDNVPLEGAAKEDVIVKAVSDGALTALDSLTENPAVPGEYAALATIAAADYLIGAAPVGTTSATDGWAGLESDLQAETIA